MYDRGVDPVSAFILAGGQSLRMGENKAFLRLGGGTLLSHALERARAAAGSACIVGSAKTFAAFGPIIEDVYPQRGPLGGIHAALSHTATDLNLVVAVDLPFIQPDFLHYLIARARETDAVVVVPKAGGGLQPLCAVYRRRFGEVADRSLRAGRNKIDSLFGEVPTRVIGPEELKENKFSEEMFRNLNTKRDWEEARKRAKDLGPRTSA